MQDTYNREQRKLVEPRSTQSWFDLTLSDTCEGRFNTSLNILKDWHKDYNKYEAGSREDLENIKGSINLYKKNKCLQRIDDILKRMYGDIRKTRMYKKIRGALLEAAQDWFRIKKDKRLNKNFVRNYHLKVENIVDQFSELVDDKDLLAKVNNCDLEEGLKDTFCPCIY